MHSATNFDDIPVHRTTLLYSKRRPARASAAFAHHLHWLAVTKQLSSASTSTSPLSLPPPSPLPSPRSPLSLPPPRQSSTTPTASPTPPGVGVIGHHHHPHQQQQQQPHHRHRHHPSSTATDFSFSVAVPPSSISKGAIPSTTVEDAFNYYSSPSPSVSAASAGLLYPSPAPSTHGFSSPSTTNNNNYNTYSYMASPGGASSPFRYSNPSPAPTSGTTAVMPGSSSPNFRPVSMVHSDLTPQSGGAGPGSPSGGMRPLSLHSDSHVYGASSAAHAPAMPHHAAAAQYSSYHQQQQQQAYGSAIGSSSAHLLPPGSSAPGSALGLGPTGSYSALASPAPNRTHASGAGAGAAAGPAAADAALDAYYRQIERAERMLEEMHLTQHDPAFTEELRAIEEWFKVLSEIERTAAMYALFQYMTPVQIRFFATLLTKMARRADPAAMFSDSRPTSLLAESDLSAPASAFQMDALQDQLLALARHQHPGGAGGGAGTGLAPRAPSASRLPSNRYSDMDAGAYGDAITAQQQQQQHRAAVAAAAARAAFEGMVGTGSSSHGGWHSVPTSATLPPPGFGPPATPFTDHNIHAERAVSPHPAKTAATWRSGSRPGSPVAGGPAGGMTLPHRIGSPSIGAGARTASLPQRGGGSGNPPGSAGLEPSRIRSPAPRGPLTPTSAPGPPSAGLGGGHRRTGSGRFTHGRAESYGGGGGGHSQPGSPSMAPYMYNGPVSPTSAGFAAGHGGPKDLALADLIQTDIAGWLRQQRLHKYTSVFERMDWRKMVALSDADLVELGVSAQGARAKFLKVFAQIIAELDLDGTGGGGGGAGSGGDGVPLSSSDGDDA